MRVQGATPNYNVRGLPRASGGPTAAADSFGAGNANQLIAAGRAVQGFGEEAISQDQTRRRMEDETKTRLAINDAQKRIADQTRIVYDQYKGAESGKAAGDMAKLTRTVREQIAAGLENPHQKEAFSRAMDAMDRETQLAAIGYRDRQMEIARNDSLDGQNALITQKAADNAAGANTPDGRAANGGRLRQILENVNLRYTGSAAEAVSLERRKAAVTFHTAVMDAQADPAAALEYLGQEGVGIALGPAKTKELREKYGKAMISGAKKLAENEMRRLGIQLGEQYDHEYEILDALRDVEDRELAGIARVEAETVRKARLAMGSENGMTPEEKELEAESIRVNAAAIGRSAAGEEDVLATTGAMENVRETYRKKVETAALAQFRAKRSRLARERRDLDDKALQAMAASGWDVNAIDPGWPDDLQDKMLDRALRRADADDRREARLEKAEKKARGLEYLEMPLNNLNERILNGEWPDIRRMAEVAEKSSVMSDDELEETARALAVPPNLAAMMNQDYPDELAKRRLYAKMASVAGPDSYFSLRFSRDPKYAAVMRGHEMAFADLQAAVKNAYASSPEIMAGWLKAAAESLYAETVGIPAAWSQKARDLRERRLELQEEFPVPEGLKERSLPEYLALEEHNTRIREHNEMVRQFQSDPAAAAEAEANREWADSVDDWLQESYLDAKADAYAGRTETGNWLDAVAAPVIEGLPSYAMAAVETYFTAGLVPLIHFALMADASGYRDMRAGNVDPLTAMGVSGLRGLGEGWIEQWSIGKAFKGPGFRELFRRAGGPTTTLRSRALRVGGHFLKIGLVEGAEEAAQGGMEAAATPFAKAVSLGDPYANIFSAVYEAKGDILKQFWGGFALGGAGGGFLGNTRHELSDMRKYNSFQRTAVNLAAAGDAALKGGKGVAETRREVRSMIHAEAAAGGMGTTVYADPGDVEAYLQGKPREEAEKTLAAIGVAPEAFDQAKTDQTDIEIPLENLAVQEGGSDPELVKLFRPTPNMATASMIAQRTREAAGVFEEARELRRIMDADAGGKVVPEPIRILRQDFRTNYGWTKEEADHGATLAWAYAKAQAERRGEDIQTFLAGSFLGNIRANMDAFIRQNPAWLRGVRVMPETSAETRPDDTAAEASGQEIVNDGEIETPAPFDPALGEGEMDFSEQQVDEGAVISGTKPGPGPEPVAAGGGESGGQAVEPPAPEPQRSLFAPPPRVIRPGEYADRLTGLPFTMETATTEGVRTDPGAFQFKRDSDAETGVKKGQEIPGDVNPAAIGTMVFFEDVDGDRFVVSGHHRIDLLRRKGEEAEVRAVILRENDGWTTDQARVYGAALNIQEGGGDTDDYATFFRETRGSLDRDRAAAEGLLRRKNAHTGYAIGALGSDNVFYGFLNGELTARQAASISTAFENVNLEASPPETFSVDHIVSGAAWWGAYDQAATGNAGFDVKGLSREEIEEKAVAYANYVVRTQQSPYQADYTRLQADNGPVSLLTQFMGGLTPYLNNTHINIRLARQAGWKGKISLGTHLLNAYVIPSVALTMLTREVWSRLLDDDEEEHELAWTLAEEMVGQAVGGLVGVRDLTRWGIKGLRTGKVLPGSGALPTFAMPERIAKRMVSAAHELLDGEAYAAGKDAGMAAAEIVGVSAPLRQLEPLAEEWGWIEEE